MSDEQEGRPTLGEIIRREAMRGTRPEDTIKLLRLLIAQDPGLIELPESQMSVSGNVRPAGPEDHDV